MILRQSGGDAEFAGRRVGRRDSGSAQAELLEVLLERGVGLLGSAEIAGLQGLAKLIEERGDRVLAGRGLRRGVLADGMMVVMRVPGALLAELLDILLDVGQVGLRGRGIPGLQILGELRNCSGQRIGVRGDGRRSGQGILCAARKQLLQ